jgi:signal transduction histidine kinase
VPEKNVENPENPENPENLENPENPENLKKTVVERRREAADWALVSRLEALETQAEAATRRGFRSAAVVDAFRMELARATRIARAAAIVSGTAYLNRRSCTAAEIAERLVKDTRRACRAAGVQLDSVVEAPAFVVPVDFALIAQALAGSVDATLAQLEEARGLDVAEAPDAPRLTLKLSAVTTRPALFIELAQDACSLAPEAVARFFDAGFDAHAGGPSAGVLLSAAARIVRLHGGRADIRRDGDVGSTITFILPQALPASAKDAD